MNEITMKTTVDRLLLMALQEDIPTEDVSTNAVLPEKTPGTVDLICKQDGVIAGLAVFARVFTLLDADSRATFFVKDGDRLAGHDATGDFEDLDGDAELNEDDLPF